MALAVSKAFPRGTFVHAQYPEDLTVDHVNNRLRPGNEGRCVLQLTNSVPPSRN